MLKGVVPFPPEFAQRYRDRGYWQDKSLAQEFQPVFERFAARVAIIDRERSFTYAELDRLSTNLALNLLNEKVMLSSFADDLPAVPRERLLETLTHIWVTSIYGKSV